MTTGQKVWIFFMTVSVGISLWAIGTFVYRLVSKEPTIPDPPTTLFRIYIVSDKGNFQGACDFPPVFTNDYEEARRLGVLYLRFKPENCVLFIEGDAWGNYEKKEGGK